MSGIVDTAALRALHGATTPGPWRAVTNRRRTNFRVRIVANGYVAYVIERDAADNNAAFMVAAHDHIPALLDEVERLREALKPFAALADQEELHERLVDDYFSLNIGVMNGNQTQAVIRHKLTVTDVKNAAAALGRSTP